MGGVGVRPWHDRGTAQQGAGRGGAGGWMVWCWGVSGDGTEGITTESAWGRTGWVRVVSSWVGSWMGIFSGEARWGRGESVRCEYLAWVEWV